MFFQGKSAQNSGQDLLKMESIDKVGDQADSDQVPRFYQKEDILDQGAQRMAAISQNSVFHGNIETKDALTVFGRLIGNISGSASVRVCGAVTGEIRCESLQSVGGMIEGDVFSLGLVELSKDSSMTGNLHCDNVVLSGSLTGDVEVAHLAILTENAVLNGNLCAEEIEARKGAKINGLIKMESIPVSTRAAQQPSLEESSASETEPALV